MAVEHDLKALPVHAGEKPAGKTLPPGPPLRRRILGRASLVASRVRSRHLFIIDTAGLVLAGVVALAVAENGWPTLDTFLWTAWLLTLVVAVRTAVDLRGGLYSHSWRFASVPDMGRIVACVLLGSGLAIVAAFGVDLVRPADSPQLPTLDFWVTEMALALAVLAGSRFAIRAVGDAVGPVHLERRPESQRTLLYGAGWAGVTLARSARRNRSSGVHPVGFMDDDPSLDDRAVAGLPVYGGLDQLERAVYATGATVLLITMPSASGEAVRRVVEAGLRLRLDVRTVPSLTDLIDGSLDAHRVRKVRVEDLLRRPMATEHAPEVAEVFAGRTVVITGAAGSIGSELARQVLAVGPRRVVLVDRAESPLYLVHRELESRLAREGEIEDGRPRIEVVTRLANVASRPMMARLMEVERPDVILHAAAYKHVPMLEDHPSEAVQVNIGGTLAVLDAAEAHGVERFVLVSTDKAVWPSSVMGASKRIAEMLVTDAAQRTGRPYVSVRFGNVLGSNGSVVPIFQDQLERGLPLTITDLQMTRFFMTISEASWLILDAAALGAAGDLFVLDMGQPVRILDLARDLARLAGRDPDSVPIEVVGLRPGEKLHEELFYDVETAQSTKVAKVLRVASEPHVSVRSDVRRLIAMADGEREDELRVTIHAVVRQPLEGGATADEDVRESGSAGDGYGAAVPSRGIGEVVVIPIDGGNGRGSSVIPVGRPAALDDHEESVEVVIRKSA